MSEITSYNIHYFRELALIGHRLYSWELDADLKRIGSNCPNEAVIGLLFPMERYKERLRALFQEGDQPVVISNELGLMVIITCKREEGALSSTYHVLGPAFFDAISTQEINDALCALRLSYELRREVDEVIQSLSLISISQFAEYGVMQHFAVTGMRTTTAEFRHIRYERKAAAQPGPSERRKQRGLYAAEQAMLKMIENGVLNFQQQHDRVVALSHVEDMGFGGPLRQNKDLMIILSSLASHAAINGGVLPETAQELSNAYIREIERATDLYDLMEINRRMLSDYTNRVHQAKLKSGISPQIKACCDYIQMNADRRLTADELAKTVNYSEKYLSTKFMKETGQTLSSYILNAKVERAKLLLLDMNMSTKDIAASLGFSSQSHFGSVFKKVTGMSPGSYRAKNGCGEDDRQDQKV